MKSMKKRIAFLGLFFVLGILMVGCSKPANEPATEPASTDAPTADAGEKKTVTVTTGFLEDMVEQLAGDKVNLEVIIPRGEDPHIYVAKPEDLKKVEEADLVLYHGLHFEGKMEEILEKTGHSVTKDFTDDEIGMMEEDGEQIKDPHFWFSIPLYKKATQEAAKNLMELLPEEKDTIEANLTRYLGEVDELQKEGHAVVESIPEKSRILITPHDAFNYFAREYGVKVEAPQGVSTDSEVAGADIERTVRTIVDNNVKAIFAESTTDPARMEKLREACAKQGVDVTVVSGEGKELLADSLAPKGEDGDTYLTMVRHDLKLMEEYMK